MDYLPIIWNFYKNLFASSRKFLLASLVIFLVTVLAGVVSYARYPDLINQLLDYFRQIAGGNPELNNRLVWAIFSQNLRSSLIALFGGAVFGVIPILIVAVNGFIIGYVENFVLSTLNTSILNKILFTVITLVPHGVFELPVVLVSAALGMRLGLRWMADSSAGRRRQVFWQDLLLCIKFLPLLVVVLTVAAFLEVYVSGSLASLAQNFLP